jgi:hypothetical protein
VKRSRTIEAAFGTALLLGPLAWAVFAPVPTVTACPQPVVRTERVEVSVPAEPELIFVEVEAEASEQPGVAPLPAFLIHEGALVLATSAEARDVSSMEVRFDFDGGGLEVTGRIDTPDEALERQLAARYDLYDAESKRCTVALSHARLHASIFGEVDWLLEAPEERALWNRAWDRRADEERPDRPLEVVLGRLMAERFARTEAVSVLADWQAVDGDCTGAVWAVPSGTDVAVWSRSEIEDEAMLDAFRSQPEVRESRSSFAVQVADSDDMEGETWVQHEAETLVMQRWQGPARSLVTAAIGVSGMCGDLDTRVEKMSFFGGARWADGPGEPDAVWSVGNTLFVLAGDADATWISSMSLATVGTHDVFQALEMATSFSPDEFYGCPC